MLANRPTKDRERTAGVRAQLASTVAAAAGPYGYTISLGGSTALAAGRLGTPGLAGVLLLMVGAVAGFAALERIAWTAATPPDARAPAPPPVAGENAHVLAAGGALLLVWSTLQVADQPATWLAVGFVATTAYFAGTVLERIALRRLAARRRRRP
jgi:hypothetical protein